MKFFTKRKGQKGSSIEFQLIGDYLKVLTIFNIRNFLENIIAKI